MYFGCVIENWCLSSQTAHTECCLFAPVTQLIALMCTSPASETDRQAKHALFKIYVGTLAMVQGSSDPDSVTLLSSLLSGVQQVVAAEPTANQNFFRQAGALTKAVKLLSAEYP
eukprot:scaffold87845_cov27-Prasinocladus_malaysianus.AAC.1